jgi:hypothetical protein
MTSYRPVVLRPNQPGSPHFDGNNVSEFLEEWSFFCEDYGLSDKFKCTRLPTYCDKDIGDNVRLLRGYASEDWATLCAGLKDLYWQHDKPKNTTFALNKLIKDAPAMDLNVYVLKYTAITETLVAKGALSTLDRVNRLMDGLPEDLRRKVLKFCTKKSWRLSAQDTGATEPVFEELREFVIKEAQSKQKETVYDKERRIREGYDDPVSQDSASLPRPEPLVLSPVTTNIVGQPATASADAHTTSSITDPIAELTKQFSELVLLVRANMSPSRPPNSNSAATSGRRPQRCLWCDDTIHLRWDCSELTKVIREGKVRINENNRIVNVATGEEFPLMLGKGGMRRLLLTSPVQSFPPSQIPQVSAANVNVGNITVEEAGYGTIGEGSVIVSTIDFENNTRIDEVIDVDVFEKRRREELERSNAARKRTRMGDVAQRGNEPLHVPATPTSSGPSQPSQPRQPYVDEPMEDHIRVHPLDRQPAPGQGHRSSQPVPQASERKYRLASKLGETVSVSDVGDKIMDSPITLKMRELFAVSSDVSSFINDQTRKHRLPVEPKSTTAASVNVDAESPYDANVSGDVYSTPLCLSIVACESHPGSRSHLLGID